MKNLLWKVVLMVLMLTMIVSAGITASAMEYPDEGYWANEAIDAAIANGLLQGKENGNIDSEANLTRAEMAAIMVRAFGATVSADVSEYVDLDSSAWYYDEFSKAVHMRVFEGDGTGHMRPNDNITREEVFAVVARALVLSDSDHSALNKFGDAADISDWAKDYMSILAQKSYVNGDNLGNANPKKNITRAEFAQLMHNIFRTYYTKAGEYTDKSNVKSTMINVGDVTFKNVTIEGDLIIGDGNGKGTIHLENVNIKGRLLVRGSAIVELVETSVGEMVVVNNYNTVVHFDNYRDEEVFDDIILNTNATFKEGSSADDTKKPAGGGGGGGGGGTTTSPTYIVQYYVENIDNADYTLVYTKPATAATAGSTVTADTTLVIPNFEGCEYVQNSGEVLSGTMPATGTLTLKVYYKRNTYNYTVKYYQQNVDNLANYDLISSEQKSDKFGATATVDAERLKDKYEHFDLNTSMSSKWSGEIPANNDSLVLEVYYDREEYTITLDYGDEYPGGKTGTVTAVYGQKNLYLKLPSPDDWTGHYVQDWYYGNTKVDESYVVTGPVTLTANWKDGVAYHVVYHLQGTDLASYPDNEAYTDTVPTTIGAEIVLDNQNMKQIDGFEYVSDSHQVLTGTVPETGTLTLHVYYNRSDVTYTVEYYQEKVTLDGYEEVVKDRIVTTGKFGTTAKADVKDDYTGFVVNNGKGLWEHTIPSSDYELVLQVYYDRDTFDYKVVYHQQNVEQNDYEVVDTLTDEQEFGTTVTVTPPADKYNGFVLNTSNQNEWSKEIPANDNLVINVYYDRDYFDYTVYYYTQDVDGNYGVPVSEVENDVFGKEINLTPNVPEHFKLNSESKLKGTVTSENDGLLELKVYYDREEYTVAFDKNCNDEDVETPASLKNVRYGTKIYLSLPSITRAGYVLEGWYDGAKKVDSNYELPDNVTLKANWVAAPATYYVKYHLEGETVGSYADADIHTEQKGSETDATVNADTEFVIIGYEYVKHPDEKLSGTVPAAEDGTLTLHVYYKRSTFKYTVKTLVENIDGTYTESTDPEEGRFKTTVKVTPSPDEGFVTNTTVSVTSGTVKADNSLELVVRYDRAPYEYTIKYWQEKVTLDGYDEVVEDREVNTEKFGKTVKVEPKKEKYGGFLLDEAKNAEWSGEIPANNELVLNVYYYRDEFEYTVEYYREYADNSGQYELISTEPETGKYGTTVIAETNPEAGFKVSDSSTLEGIVTDDSKLVLTVKYERLPYKYSVKYWKQNTSLDGYDILADTVNTSAKFGTTVKADTSKIYEHFTLDSNLDSEWSDVVPAKDDELVLNVYYYRTPYKVTYDANGGSEIKIDEPAYYGVGYKLPGIDASTHQTDDTQELKGWKIGNKTYGLNETVTIGTEHITVTGTEKSITITAVWGDKDTETKYGEYEVYYYKDDVQSDYDAPKGVEVGSYKFTPDANKYGDSYILKSDNVYTLDIVEGMTTTFRIYYVTKPDDVDYVTVTFYNYRNQNVGTVELESGNSMSDENKSIPDSPTSMDGYVKDESISSIYSGENEYTHTVNWGWYYNPTTLKLEPFTDETKVEVDTDVYSRVRYFNANVFVTPMADKLPEGFPFDAYYETDTRFADTLKDILAGGVPLDTLKASGYWDTLREKLVGFELFNSIDEDDNIQMQYIPVRFADVIGEDELEDYIIDSAKDMFGEGNNEALKDAFVTYLETAYNSGNQEKVDEIVNLMVKTIDHILAENPKTIEDLCREILADKEAFEEITGEDYDTLLSKDVRDFAVEYIVKELSENDDLLNTVLMEYMGKELADLPEDPEELVVALAAGMLEDVEFLGSVIKDLTGVDVTITDDMTVKQLFVKVAEIKLESDDSFLESAIAQVLGEGITVSIKDDEGNYKSTADYFAEIAVSKLGNDEELFADAVLKYIGTDISAENKSIREFFIDVVKDDLDNADSKLIASFIKEFTGYEIAIDENTTTKDFFVEAIMTMLENESELFAKVVEDVTDTTVSVDGKDMQTFFKDVVAERLSNDTALLGKVIYEVTGYDIDVDDSTSTRDFFVALALTKLESESDFLDTATESVLGIKYSDLDADAKNSARVLIATVIEDKLSDKGTEYDEAVELVFEGNGLPTDSTDVVLSFVAYRLMTDDTYYETVMDAVPDADESERKVAVQEYVATLMLNPDTIEDETGFDVNAYSTYSDEAFIQLVKEEVIANDTAFEEITEYKIADITDEYNEVKTAKDFITDLAEEKLNDESDTYLEEVVTDLGYDLNTLASDAKSAISSIAQDKIDTDEAFRDAIAKRFNFPEDMDWTADAKATILDITEGNLKDDDTYLGDLVLSELGYELSELSDNAVEMIVYVVGDKLTNASEDELNSTLEELEYEFTIDDWDGTAKEEILKVVEAEFKKDTSKIQEAMKQVGINITITDWNEDAKTTVVELAKDMLDDEDNKYLNKIVEKLNIPASITKDWNANAIETIQAYAEDKLETDEDFFYEVTGYYPSELKGKTSKDVIISIVETQLETNDSLFETATGWKVEELPETAADFMVETVLKELASENSATRKLIEEKAVDYLLNHHDKLDRAADLALDYLGAHPDERDEIVDTIIDELYREALDKLIYELINEDTFTITPETEFIAEGLKIKIENEYNYETLLGSRIPEKVFEVYPEEKLKDIYNLACDNLMKQIEDAIAAATDGKSAEIDSAVTIIFNPVDDFYTPLYDRLLELIQEKGEDNQYYYYYDENEYLQEFIKLLSTESLFEGSIDGETDTLSGYKLRSLDDYYNLIVKMTILGDDAILWYYNSDIVDDFEKVTDSHQKLILKYVNATADALDRYATDGTLPSDNDKLSAVEKAFKDRYPKIVEELVIWYKDSDINKDYNDDDFQKVQDTVRKAFEYVNLTTDEFFDIILGYEKLQEAEKLEEYYEKISDDEYKVEVKGNIVTFLRDIVDA